MAVAFTYMFKSKESRKSLLDIFNTLPDGVMVLTMSNVPKNVQNYGLDQESNINFGDVGANHYDMLYCNK